MTKAIEKKLPALYATEHIKPDDKICQVKFFDPCGSWTWYSTEGEREGDDFIFFGFVRGFENELGNFSLKELQSVRGPLGLGIERDLHFKSGKVKDFIDRTSLAGC